MAVKVLIFLILVFLSPLAVLSTIAFMILKTVVKYSAKIFRKDLSEILGAVSSHLAVDRLHETPKNNLVFGLVLDEDLDVHKLKQQFERKMLESGGAKKFPELKKYPVGWCGYFFWKSDKFFNFDNHCKVIDDGKRYSEEDVQRLSQNWVEGKWTENRPVWEFIVIKNYFPQEIRTKDSLDSRHTFLVWRSHHSLGDGYSLVNLFECIWEMKITTAVPNVVQQNCFYTFVNTLLFPVFFVWEISELVLRAIPLYSFTAPLGSLNECFYTELVPVISMNDIKNLKNQQNVSFTAVLFAALTGAIRDYHLKRNMDFPEVYPCVTILPHAGHNSSQLMNCMNFGLTYMPVREIDLLKRLLLTHKDYLRFKSSALSCGLYYYVCAVGSHVKKVIGFIQTLPTSPCGITNFPISSTQLSFVGHNVTDFIAWTTPLEGRTGVCVALMSYVDRLRISTTAKSSVMSKDELKDFASLIEKNFKDLLQSPMLGKKKE